MIVKKRKKSVLFYAGQWKREWSKLIYSFPLREKREQTKHVGESHARMLGSDSDSEQWQSKLYIERVSVSLERVRAPPCVKCDSSVQEWGSKSVPLRELIMKEIMQFALACLSYP